MGAKVEGLMGWMGPLRRSGARGIRFYSPMSYTPPKKKPEDCPECDTRIKQKDQKYCETCGLDLNDRKHWK